MLDFNGQVVLVTGAEGNLGPHVTDRLVELGATVVGTYHNEKSKAWADDRAKLGDQVHYYRADVTDPSQLEDLASTVEREHGEVWGLVNLVGGFGFSTISEITVDEFRNWFDVLATTTFLATKTFLPQLESTGGSVVNFTSHRALYPTPDTFAYNVGKGAVKTMTESLAADLDRVRVNAIAPLFIATPEKREDDANLDFDPWHLAEDIIELVVFLLESPSVNGQIIEPTRREPGATPVR